MTKLINPLAKKPGTRRALAKADKKRRILEASRNLFSSQGFDQTTVQQIVDAADVAVGTLFLYVADKSELLLLLYQEKIESELLKARKFLKSNRKLIPSAAQFFTQLMSLYEHDLKLSRIYIREFLFHEGRVRAKLDQQNAEIIQVLQDRILQAQQKGEIAAHVDPQVGALHMYALYHSTLSFYLASCRPSQSPGQMLEVLLNSYLVGMLPSSASSVPALRKRASAKQQR